MQRRLRQAQIRAHEAEARAKVAQAALNTERSQHSRSKQLNIALTGLALALSGLAGLVGWRVKRRAARTIAAVQQDLANADRILEHQKALEVERAQSDLQRAFAAMEAAAVQRDNLSARLKAREESLIAAQAEIARLKAEIDALKAAIVKRQAASAKTQIKALKLASNADKPMLDLRPILNDEEQRLAPLLQTWADENGVRLLAQVSMGEFLSAHQGALYHEIFSTYNSKRVDFLICNEDWSPRFVIEHFGGGHFGKGYALQDEVKSRLLNLSGLGLVITLSDDQKEDILEKVRRAHLSPASAVPACNPFERVMPPWTRGRTRMSSFFKTARSG